MPKYYFFLLLSVIFCGCQKTPPSEQEIAYTQYVNPFLGTAPLLDTAIIGYTPPEGWRVWAGLVFPGSSLPNAMVQLSPMTEYHSGAGYEYEDSVIYGFTHTNKGHWNLCNVPVLPVSGNAKVPFQSTFTHQRESASPGYYQVYLNDYQVDVQLTSTLRAGFHRYQFDDLHQRQILFDLGKANNDVRDWHLEQSEDSVLQGYQETGGEKVYFYATLNGQVADLNLVQAGQQDGYALVSLTDESPNPVTLKIGLSFVSIENARDNLTQEIGKQSFNQIREQANWHWEDLLKTIRVAGGSDRERQLFYSSLYRSFLWPALRSDVNGEYTDVKGEVAQADFQYYTTPSLWDTYRNKLVLLALVSPDVTRDVIRSMVDIGSKTGFIPTFFHGDHGAAFIAGSYLRGIRNFDVDKAYQLLLNNAYKEGGTRPHIQEYIDRGYIATPQVDHPHVETKAKAGVTKTQEYAYDDFALSLLATSLGDTMHAQDMMKRSANYKHVFDKETRLMRGRLENGDWVTPFDPTYPYYEYMYREANGWQSSFFAPHDMDGLISLFGGKDAFEAQLDSLYSIPWNPEHIARNVSGFIGQYCHGNQPDHQAPFLYHFVGKPEKSQKIIDQILKDYYGIGREGLALSGMDDAGEMSSWYVFSAMGLYPFSPADTTYLVSVPIFDQVTWKLEDGHELKIRHRGGAGRHMDSVTVRGQRLDGFFVNHDLFVNGGKVTVYTD